MADLVGYVEVPAAATVGGAPIDAFQGDAFRGNDLRFNAVVSAISQNMWLRNDNGGNINSGAGFDPRRVTRCETFDVSTAITVTDGFPLIIMASETITLNANITAVGASTAAAGLPGCLGGGGG
ncbi:MAG: hypothetical protein AAF570_07660, partial [Bacteroidota bacterium]